MYIDNSRKVRSRLKARAKKKGIPFDLPSEFLDEIGLPISCPLLNTPIDYNSVKRNDNSPSIDRIDSNGGYTMDNIEIISWRANRIKNDGTKDELKLIGEQIKHL